MRQVLFLMNSEDVLMELFPKGTSFSSFGSASKFAYKVSNTPSGREAIDEDILDHMKRGYSLVSIDEDGEMNWGLSYVSNEIPNKLTFDMVTVVDDSTDVSSQIDEIKKKLEAL